MKLIYKSKHTISTLLIVTTLLTGSLSGASAQDNSSATLVSKSFLPVISVENSTNVVVTASDQPIQQQTINDVLNDQVPDNIKKQAVSVLAERNGISPDEIEVTNSTKVLYELQGLIAYEFKVITSKGEIDGIALDPNGTEVRIEEVDEKEYQLYVDKYGKITPDFRQELDTVDSGKPIDVAIWLVMPESADQNMPQRPTPEKELSEDEVTKLYEELDAVQAKAVQATIAPILEKVQAMGYEVATDEKMPLLYAQLPPEVIREVARWEGVSEIYKAPIVEPFIDISRNVVRANVVNNRGMTGSGIRVAEIEVGGQIALNNPFLSGVTQDTVYSCLREHGTMVAGVIHSTHPTDRGVSPDTQLWVGGSCGGVSSQLTDRSTAAANWGARAFNLSWGSYAGTGPGSVDRFYDRMVMDGWRTVVIAAGNSGWNGIVASPARAYNVISVGSFDDRNTDDALLGGITTGDDQMSEFSSARNPRSWHGDREKPEVVAPGSNINMTTNSWPWVGSASGTSFAAPHVTGISALLMQRNSALQVWPEGIKAILMTTARHNIEGDSWLSGLDGAGGVLANMADDVAQGINGNWGGTSYSCSNPRYSNIAQMSLKAGRDTRTTITWDTNPNYWLYSWRPSADLDLHIIDPSGRVVARSASWDNTYEIVQFTPANDGIYTIQAINYRCNQTPKWLGWAWHQQPQPPVALCVANPALGVGSVTTTFSDNGSYDPDGSIVSYQWNFSDNSSPLSGPGPHSITFVNNSHRDRYYFGYLTVTDNNGNSSGALCEVKVACEQSRLPPGLVCMP